MTQEEPQGAQSVVLSDEHATVTISKHTTPNGSRLSIRPEQGPERRLDALELESVTWQSEGFLDDLIHPDDRRPHPSTAASTEGVDPASVEPRATIQVGNEYALVEVRAIEITRAEQSSASSRALPGDREEQSSSSSRPRADDITERSSVSNQKSKISGDSDERLLVASVKMGYTIVLGPSELATLARQNPSFFSALLETPLGPEPDDLVEFH